MPQPIAYLAFNGNCREAMQFYARALEGQIEAMLSQGESPMAGQMPPESKDSIMHACLNLPQGGVLMAGDHCCGDRPYEGMKGFQLTLNYDTVEEAELRFRALAEGGTVVMDMQPTFWAKTWGMLVDRFGTPWIVNGETIPMETQS